MLLALLFSLDAHAGRALEATYTFLPEGTTLGGAERVALGGFAFTGNSGSGRLTGHSELRALFGAGMPQQGFAWDSELLLGMRYWPAGALGFGLDTGIGASAVGDALPRGFRVPLEARLTLTPGRWVLEPYFRVDTILGQDNIRQDGGTLIDFGDELRYGADFSYIVDVGRLNTFTLGYRRTEQLGVVTNGVMLQLWLNAKDNDEEELYYEDTPPTEGELTPEESEAMLGALEAMMNPTSDEPILTGDPFCDAVNNIYAAAPGNFTSVRGAEIPADALSIGKRWGSTIQVPGATEPATIYESTLGAGDTWVTVMYHDTDAAAARAVHDATVEKLTACKLPRVMVTDAQELENVRYNTWFPFVSETDAYTSWIIEVQTSRLPDIKDEGGQITVVDSYQVIVRVSRP